MNVTFTNEQIEILLSNESFRKELISSCTFELTKGYSSLYHRIANDIKGEVKSDITKGIISSQIIKDPEFAERVDKKVDQVLQEFISKSIGKFVFNNIFSDKKECGDK